MFKHPKVPRLAAIALALVMLLSLSGPALACSGLELTSKEGNHYWFRTCDMDNTYNVFGENGSYIAPSYLVSYPAGQPIPFTTGDVTAAHTIVGMSFSDSLALLDGINDAGLVGGLLFLNEGTETEDADVPEDCVKLAAMEGITWFLAQCKDVDEVVALADKTCMQALHVEGILGSELSATLHFTFVDANGKSVVLETADPAHPGRFTIHESIGVMTNSPPYDWQLDNLKDYIGNSPELRSQGITSITLKGIRLDGKPGSADRTYPASNSAYDRFTRLAIARYLCDEGREIPDSQMLAKGSGVFACVNVAEDNGKGTYYYDMLNESGEVEGSGPCYTQYTVFYDIAERSLAIRPYDSMIWTTLSVADADPAARKTFPIFRGGADQVTVSANSSAGGTAQTPAASGDQGTYTVQPGDYLAKIAKDVYGDAGKWNAIYEANRAAMRDPNALAVGQVLILPII